MHDFMNDMSILLTLKDFLTLPKRIPSTTMINQ